MSERIETYEDFWPFYLSEHRDARSRRLHFAGTSAWLTSLAASTALNPIAFPAAMAGFGLIVRDALKKGEGQSPRLKHVLGMLVLPSLAAPVTFPAGVVAAYGCAWVGHFGIEGNRPATFKYPVWSLASDFRMWKLMLQGKLWSGDPLEKLGLEDPAFEEPVSEEVVSKVDAGGATAL